jgi:VanZ family protein
MEPHRMSTSPTFFSPSPISPQSSVHIPSRRSLRNVWIPVLCALVFIRCTSTSFMSGSHTEVLVDAVWRAVFGHWHWNLTSVVNGEARKVGHFFGYGIVGLIFRKAWYTSMRAYALAVGSKLVLFASSLGVACTFLVACLDEWHQKFVPGRVSSFHDVMVDTTGAMFLTLVVLVLRARRRRKALRTC